MAHAMWRSISMIFSTESDSSKGDWVRFSTARTTPSDVWMPTVVEPSCVRRAGVNLRRTWGWLEGEAERTLMASMAYSTVG